MSRADPKTARKAIIAKLEAMVSRAYDHMSLEDIARSQKKLKAIRDRVRAGVQHRVGPC